MNLEPTYLGDGVYIQREENGRHCLALTTGSHRMEEADNVIILEPEVATQLYFVLQKLAVKTGG